MTLQDRRPRQQNFMRNEPGGGPVEQHAGPIRAGPAQGVKPSIEPELGRAVGEFHVPAALPDFQPCGPTAVGLYSIRQSSSDARYSTVVQGSTPRRPESPSNPFLGYDRPVGVREKA